MILIFFALAMGAIAGGVATTKGRSFLPWFIYGTLLPIIAVIHIAVVGFPEKKCPRCAEMVKHEALTCRHCGFEFPQPEAGLSAPRN